jgi:hypothetical protein
VVSSIDLEDALGETPFMQAIECVEKGTVCRYCQSENLKQFSAEINVHFSGMKNLEKAGVLVFPKIVACLDCGFSQFTLPESAVGSLKA